ncbi:MAG: hypothetical protein J7K58_05950 [Euryarchaeota archaeon]|nr:hypothetical protein [Euryarchaeota archaeon]
MPPKYKSPRRKKYGKYALSPSERAVIYYKGKPMKAKDIVQYILPAVSLILAHFVFTSDLGIFLSIIALIPIFVVMKYDARVIGAYAIAMLIVAAIILAIYNNEDAANLAAIYAYWFLVDTVICEIIEYIRENRSKSEEKLSNL